MTNTPQKLQVRRSVLWSLGILILLVVVLYGGWTAVQRYAVSEANDSINVEKASPQDQMVAEHAIQGFLDSVRHHAYAQALILTASTYPAPHQPQTLEKIGQTQLAPLLDTNDLRFDPVQLASHGQKMYLRGRFHSGGKFYRTVCSLTQENGSWRVSNILPPTEASKAATPEIIGRGRR